LGSADWEKGLKVNAIGNEKKNVSIMLPLMEVDHRIGMMRPLKYSAV